MNFYSNRGMFLEELIGNTIKYFKDQNKKIIIYKRNLPIKLIRIEKNKITGSLKEKSTTDYYGVFEGRMIDFEAKQTKLSYFITANLKDHQKKHLIDIWNSKGFSFIIIYFIKFDEYFCITTKEMQKIWNKTKIPFSWFKKNGLKIEIIFPGILSLENYLIENCFLKNEMKCIL